MKNFGDPAKMRNRDWIEVFLLKCKHENYPIETAIDLIYKYVEEEYVSRESHQIGKKGVERAKA